MLDHVARRKCNELFPESLRDPSATTCVLCDADESAAGRLDLSGCADAWTVWDNGDDHDGRLRRNQAAVDFLISQDVGVDAAYNAFDLDVRVVSPKSREQVCWNQLVTIDRSCKAFRRGVQPRHPDLYAAAMIVLRTLTVSVQTGSRLPRTVLPAIRAQRRDPTLSAALVSRSAAQCLHRR